MMELRGDLPGGRRELRMRVGPYTAVVSEIPGASLTEREWADVLLSRRSYTAMWGGDGDEAFATDAHDGRGEDARFFDAHHYLAWVRDDASGPAQLVSARKVRVVPDGLTAAQRENPLPLLPVDVRFWRVAREGGFVPLWEVLRERLRELGGEEPAEFRFACMGRTGTFPFGEPDRSARARGRTAIAFACIQILAAHGDPSALWLGSLCPELRDRVLSVRDMDGGHVAPDFTRTEDVLELPPGSVSLDNALPLVRVHKAARPGYFVDNVDGARALRALLDEGLLTPADLAPSMLRLVQHQLAAGAVSAQLRGLTGPVSYPDHGRLADVLTRPRAFRFLIPLLAGRDPLTRMTVGELRRRLLYETKDGPFSSTLHPAAWAASAWRVLDVIAERHACAAADRDATTTRPLPVERGAPPARMPDRLAG